MIILDQGEKSCNCYLLTKNYIVKQNDTNKKYDN